MVKFTWSLFAEEQDRLEVKTNNKRNSYMWDDPQYNEDVVFTFDDVDEIFTNPMITSGNPLADNKMQFNRVVTPDLTQNIESYISNGASVAKDPNGNLLVFFKNGEYGYHNAPGLTKVDLDQFITTGTGFGFASKINQGLFRYFKLSPYGGQFLHR